MMQQTVDLSSVLGSNSRDVYLFWSCQLLNWIDMYDFRHDYIKYLDEFQSKYYFSCI